MNPADKIRGEKSDILKGRKIALAVTGSIACVEDVKIARELIRHGAEVYPYMTEEAKKFIGEISLQFATGNDVVSELTGRDEHLENFDLILVAPATADIISKSACGIADDAVSTLILANLEKCVFVPTMELRMYHNPVFRENLEKIKKYSEIIERNIEEGKLKIPNEEIIAAEVMHRIRDDLKGKKILVIGGAGYEKIDNFRIITNLSTGKTAIDIAKYSYYFGGNVKLLLSLHSFPVPEFLYYEHFEGVNELLTNIENFKDYDAIIVPAALPDFRTEKKRGKISYEEFKKIEWKENPKFLKELRKMYDGFLVGFKLESGISEEELIKRARKRMEDYQLDMIVANLMENVKNDENEVIIIMEDEIEKVKGKKENIARRIVERVVDAI